MHHLQQQQQHAIPVHTPQQSTKGQHPPEGKQQGLNTIQGLLYAPTLYPGVIYPVGDIPTPMGTGD